MTVKPHRYGFNGTPREGGSLMRKLGRFTLGATFVIVLAQALIISVAAQTGTTFQVNDAELEKDATGDVSISVSGVSDMVAMHIEIS